MVKVFDNITLRKSFSLDGIWNFIAADGDYKNGITGGEDISVPSCWNCDPVHFHYEGAAWYEKDFITDAKNIRIVFEGVLNECEVYLDGVKLGYHYGGFSEFAMDVFDLEPGEHKLCVRVDNTHDDMNTIPLDRVDWYHYGGIFRSVSIIELADVYIHAHLISYELSEDLKDVTLCAKMALNSFEKKTVNAKFMLDGAVLAEKTVDVDGHTDVVFDDVEVKYIRLWDIGKGELYKAELVIDDDSICEMIGFRKVEARGRDIYLNNRPIKIKGVNRHEEHADWGFAMPANLIKRDIDLIIRTGCNAIRASHYQNSRFTLDYCDKKGILFWEEIPMWGFKKPEVLANPVVIERGLGMHRELITAHYHHPCIIFWGMHNEINTTCPEGYAITKKFSDLVRSLDNSRLITFASDMPLDDICMSLCDVASVNAYYGWYRGTVDDWPEFLKQFRAKLVSEGLEKPFIMSEFGAGGIYGTHSFDKQVWSEEYQEEYLRKTLELFTKDDDLAGTYIWQFCDIRSSKNMQLSRPRSFNNKGLVNEFRRPKLVYHTVQKIYSETKDTKYVK